MSIEVYTQIANAMECAHNVDFTGWGEPLLHRRIYEMIAMAKKRGCATSMTSNGTALDAANAERLIDAGMDRLTVSIDGLTPETYDRLRVGASLEKVEANLRRLSDRVEKRSSTLELGIAFTIQEANVFQIADTADWATLSGPGRCTSSISMSPRRGRTGSGACSSTGSTMEARRDGQAAPTRPEAFLSGNVSQAGWIPSCWRNVTSRKPWSGGDSSDYACWSIPSCPSSRR